MQISGDYHFHICRVYVSPSGSSSEKESIVSSYEMLQQDLADILAHNGLALVVGDFNPGTGSTSSTCLEEFRDIWTPPESHMAMDSFVNLRSPEHQLISTHVDLERLCKMSDICISKRGAPGDTNGWMTCMPDSFCCCGLLSDKRVLGKNSARNGCT